MEEKNNSTIIVADLKVKRHELEQIVSEAKARFDEAQRKIEGIDFVLGLSGQRSSPVQEKGENLTTKQAIVKLLRDAKRSLTRDEVFEGIGQFGLRSSKNTVMQSLSVLSLNRSTGVVRPKQGKYRYKEPSTLRLHYMRFTIQDFQERFHNDTACLQYLFDTRFGKDYACPKCSKIGQFYLVKGRRCFACSCGEHQVYPVAGTVFEGSGTSLKTWFYAMFEMSKCKNGISAKELQSRVGVAYGTALRMARKIRKLMTQSPMTLEGTVEADETYIGGKDKYRGRSTQKKSVVFGIVQRKGRVKMKHVSNVKRTTVMPLIRKNVEIGTNLMTDEFASYKSASIEGYKHDYIKHAEREYVRGDVYTNTIEGVWSQTKRSIDGTFHHVSPSYLQLYLDEFAFRYNYRVLEQPIFETLLERLAA